MLRLKTKKNIFHPILHKKSTSSYIFRKNNKHHNFLPIERKKRPIIFFNLCYTSYNKNSLGRLHKSSLTQAKNKEGKRKEISHANTANYPYHGGQ